jgi:acetyl-CoA acetyltransferase
MTSIKAPRVRMRQAILETLRGKTCRAAKSSFVTPSGPPFGAYGGSLKPTPATALVVKTVLERAKLDAARIGSVVMGNVIQAGNKMNPARQAAISGGVPVDAPTMTVNRVCGSGAQAIASAAQEIWLGYTDAAIAGGMENMDTAPYLMSGGRWGCRTGNAHIYDSMLRDGLKRGVVTLCVGDGQGIALALEALVQKTVKAGALTILKL